MYELRVAFENASASCALMDHAMSQWLWKKHIAIAMQGARPEGQAETPTIIRAEIAGMGLHKSDVPSLDFLASH